MKTYRSQFPVASSSWIITVPSSWLWPKEMMSQTRSRQSFLLIEAEDTDNIGQYRLASSSKTKQTRNERPKSVFHGNQISAAFEIEYRANIEGAIDYAFFLKMSPCPYVLDVLTGTLVSYLSEDPLLKVTSLVWFKYHFVKWRGKVHSEKAVGTENSWRGESWVGLRPWPSDLEDDLVLRMSFENGGCVVYNAKVRLVIIEVL